MPNIDSIANNWEQSIAGRVGRAVEKRRKALGLTAAALANRTEELGYPIHRVAISKIEGNKRAGKLDVAELLALAQALEIPPTLLLFPGYPDDDVQGLPGRETKSVAAAWWVAGTRTATGTPGTDLVRLVEQRADVMWELNKLDRLLLEQIVEQSKEPQDEAEKALTRRIQMTENQLETLDADIRRARAELWGGEEV